MRNGLIGLMTAVLASSIASAGCGSSSSTGGAGGSGSGGLTGTGGGSSGVGGSAGGGGVTSVGSAKALNALTPAEATQLCDDVYSYFGNAIPRATGCKWKGLFRAASSSPPTQNDLRQICTTNENSCLQSDAGVVTNLGCGDIPTNCTATVAQYSACIAAEVTDFNQTVTSLPTCTTVMSTGTSAIFEAQAPTPPASCASLSDACPALTLPTPLNN